MRIGIIGCGDMGMGHVAGFHRIDGCKIVAVADPGPERIESCRNIVPDVAAYPDFKDLLARKDIDAVVVAVPNYLHREAATAVLQAGKHLFLEKPMAHTMRDCDAIIEAHHKSGLLMQVGLVYRYSNLYRSIAQVAESGQMGQISMVYCRELRENFPMPWFFDQDKSGGALVDKNCHHFDLFNWFVRSRPVNVYAAGGRHVVKGDEYTIRCSYSRQPHIKISRPNIVDHAFVTVEYEKGAVGSLALCMYESEPIQGLEIGVIGANGTHMVAQRDVMLTAGGGPLGEDHEVPIDYYSDNEDLGHLGAQRERIEFIRCIRENNAPYCGAAVARECLAVSLAAEVSIREKRRVSLAEFDNSRIRDILSEYPDPFALNTPDPLPAPKLFDSIAPAPRRRSRLLTFLALIRMALGRKETRGIYKEFSATFFRRLAHFLNTDKRYRDAARGLTTSVVFTYPERVDVIINVKNGAVYVSEVPAASPVTVGFTEKGWRGFFNGESLNRLSLQRDISVKGNYKDLVPHSEALFSMVDMAKKL